MKQDIWNFVVECDLCQHNKGEIVKSPRILQTLPTPPAIWRDISMDFIVGLPKLGNKSVIMVVVDHLSKYAHFCALQHPFTSSTVAQLFMDQVFKIHGMPHSIFFITTQLSPTIFGKKCSIYKTPNCISAQLIIPRLMVKLKWSTSIWKHI